MNRHLALLALLFAVAPRYSSAQEKIGAFTYVERIDGMADENTSSIFVPAEGSHLLGTPRLYWRCTDTTMEMYVASNDFLNAGEPVPVQWRFDSEPASQPVRWTVSADGRGVFASRDVLQSLANSARRAATVLFRITDLQGSRHDLRFSLVGSSVALDRLPCSPPDPVADAPEVELDPSAGPTSTPMTVPPKIKNTEEVIQAMEREYPAMFRNAGIGGRVVVWLFIDETGRVRDKRISQTSGHAGLDEAALIVAEVFRFTPALRGEEKVQVWVQFPITFEVR